MKGRVPFKERRAQYQQMYEGASATFETDGHDITLPAKSSDEI